MRYARIAIGLAALMVMLSAGLVTVCDSDSSDALAIENGSIAYNSDDGFFLEVTDAGRSVIVRAVDGLSGPWVGQNIDGNVHAVLNGDSEINDEGTFRYIIVSGSSSIDGSISIVSLQFDRNGGTGGSDIGTKYLSQGYSGYTVDTPNWTKDGQTIMGWSTSPNGGVEYGLNDALPSDSSDVLYAVYGDPVYPTGVTITGAPEGDVDVGFEGTLVAEVVPEDAWYTAEWSSSDSEVVSVDGDGNIVANSPGTAVIRVTVADGIYDEVTIVVVGAVPVTGVELDRSEAGLSIGETIQLNASVVPADATNQAVSWSSSNEGVVTVDENGLVTAEGEGTATITVTTAEGGFEAECVVTVTSEPATYYDVTVLESEGGTASAEPASAEEGATVTLSYTANDGYRFVEWISDDVEITGDRFVMPAKDVTVTAVFEAIPPTEYTIIVNQATGGTATASAATAIEGAVITLTATPDDGYVLDHWVINSDDVYRNTFTMPAGNVTVTPVFRALDNYDVTIEISGEGTVLNGGSEVMDGTMITVRELSDLVLTYTAGEDNYTVRCTVSDENARVSNASGTLTVSGISTDCTVTIEFVQGYMVSVNGGDHGEVSPGTGLQAENATVTYTVRPDAGYAVNRVLVDGQEVVVTGNQFQVDVGSSTHSIIVEYVFVGIVDDDDEEYVPSVVVVPKGDDDTTTYIVAIAAAAVVAVLAAIILMQSRKS